MAVIIEDLRKIKDFLEKDPLRNAVAIQRVFRPREKAFCVADGNDVKSLAVVEDVSSPSESRSLAIVGPPSEAMKDVVDALPSGRYWMQVADEHVLALLKDRMRLGWHARAWLLSINQGTLKAVKKHETRDVEERWAHRIAKIWSPDWNADSYVSSRIERGPSSGIYVDGELVAWGLTHFETEKVSMLGFLYVMPAHRQRGYAETITADMAEKVFARGMTPACHVYEHNYASLALMELSGFRRLCRQVWGDAVTRA